MLQRNCILLALAGGCVIIANPAYPSELRFALTAQSLPTLTPQQLNRLSRDLTPTNSQDFFRQGRSQLEREIQRLERVQTTNSDRLLRIAPATRYPEKRPLPRFVEKK